MQLDRRIRFTLLLTVSVGLTSTLLAAPHKVTGKWQKDWLEAQAEAKRTGKPILLHFYASWCAPCRQMEREVLSSKRLNDMIGERFIAVKIDTDAHPELPELYGVDALPADVYVAPDGKLIAKSEGYDNAGKYFAALADFDRAWRVAERTYIARSERAAREAAPPVVLPKEQPVALPKEEPVATPAPVLEPPDLKRSESEPVLESPPVEPTRSREILGLNGFCPVTLGTTREWKKGDRTWIYEHQEIVYLMADEAAYKAFREHPDDYAPRLLGCDPVVLFQSSRAIPGSTKYGAYFDGQLYLFTTADTRTQFKQNPIRYVQSKHVLRVDDLELTRLR